MVMKKLVAALSLTFAVIFVSAQKASSVSIFSNNLNIKLWSDCVCDTNIT